MWGISSLRYCRTINSLHYTTSNIHTLHYLPEKSSFGCSPSTSSDFAEMRQNHAKKLDLAERIRMH